MTVHDNQTWAFLRLDPDYRAAQAVAASTPEYEAAPFPVRVRSEGDLAAVSPWRLLAWEDPDGPAAPFWDIPMLDCVLADDEPPLVDLARAAGASLGGLRLGPGVLVLRVERGGAAVQLRLRDAAGFPEGGGIELRQGVLGLPQTMPRVRDLWKLISAPAPATPPGRARGVRYGEMAGALEAFLAGRSHRETAALLWGADAVADWHPDDAVRSRVRNRLRSAKALMHGGYRERLPKV